MAEPEPIELHDRLPYDQVRYYSGDLQSAIDAVAANGRILWLDPGETYTLGQRQRHGTCCVAIDIAPVRIEGNGATIKAAVECEAVLEVGVGGSVIRDVIFHGNRLAERCVRAYNAGRSRFEDCRFTAGVIDGVGLAESSGQTSDYVEFRNCRFWDNGRCVAHGYAGQAFGNLGAQYVDSHSATASVSVVNATGWNRHVYVQFSESIADTGVRHGDGIVLGAAGNRTIGYVSDVGSDTELLCAVEDDPITFEGAGLDWLISRGDGLHCHQHPDNNCTLLTHCEFAYNAGWGASFGGLYGGTLINCQMTHPNFGNLRVGRTSSSPVQGMVSRGIYSGDGGGFDGARPCWTIAAVTNMDLQGHYILSAGPTSNGRFVPFRIYNGNSTGVISYGGEEWRGAPGAYLQNPGS